MHHGFAKQQVGEVDFAELRPALQFSSLAICALTLSRVRCHVMMRKRSSTTSTLALLGDCNAGPLAEVQILTVALHRYYNTVRLHCSLGCR
jgi:hypothetical protein